METIWVDNWIFSGRFLELYIGYLGRAELGSAPETYLTYLLIYVRYLTGGSGWGLFRVGSQGVPHQGH